MHHPRTEDPADLVVAWEAVEELLAVVPESSSKDVLRLVAAGLPPAEIAERLGLAVNDVDVLAARGRIRVLTAALSTGRTSPSRPIPPAA
ncbi:MAG TPA: hypothetical protein VM324_01545 [Egibacteraceae bacterium]|jgi:DNA-directed RNA polymerase specialized sigma24 family protein|nr:hypothetical protein [Egibacteraceae bacterium]